MFVFQHRLYVDCLAFIPSLLRPVYCLFSEIQIFRMAMRYARNVRRLKRSASACLFVCVPNRARLECHAKHLHAVDEANKQSIRFCLLLISMICNNTGLYMYTYMVVRIGRPSWRWRCCKRQKLLCRNFRSISCLA